MIILLRWCAFVLGLNGETPMEKARVVMVVESVSEIFQKLAAVHYEKDEAKKVTAAPSSDYLVLSIWIVVTAGGTLQGDF